MATEVVVDVVVVVVVVVLSVVICFAVLLFFNACDVTKKLASDAP